MMMRSLGVVVCAGFVKMRRLTAQLLDDISFVVIGVKIFDFVFVPQGIHHQRCCAFAMIMVLSTRTVIMMVRIFRFGKCFDMPIADINDAIGVCFDNHVRSEKRFSTDGKRRVILDGAHCVRIFSIHVKIVIFQAVDAAPPTSKVGFRVKRNENVFDEVLYVILRHGGILLSVGTENSITYFCFVWYFVSRINLCCM